MRLGWLLGKRATSTLLLGRCAPLGRYSSAIRIPTATVLLALEEYLRSVDSRHRPRRAQLKSHVARRAASVYTRRSGWCSQFRHDAKDLPAALADEETACAETVAYVCRGTTCSEPIRSLAPHSWRSALADASARRDDYVSCFARSFVAFALGLLRVTRALDARELLRFRGLDRRRRARSPHTAAAIRPQNVGRNSMMIGRQIERIGIGLELRHSARHSRRDWRARVQIRRSSSTTIPSKRSSMKMPVAPKIEREEIRPRNASCSAT